MRIPQYWLLAASGGQLPCWSATASCISAIFSHAESQISCIANQASGPGEALKTRRGVTFKSSWHLRQQAGRQRC